LSLAAIFLIGYGTLLTVTLIRRLIVLPNAYQTAKKYAALYERTTGNKPEESLISPALIGSVAFSVAVNIGYWLSLITLLQ
jgi:hypothetical protein